MSSPDSGRAPASLFLEAASFKPLAILRAGLAAVLLAQGALLWRYREILLDEAGPVAWVIGDLLLDPALPRLSYVAAWLQPFGIASDAVVSGVLAAHMGAALMLLVGYRTRAAAIVAWLTFLPMRYSGHLYFYGIGGMLLIALFYCACMPVGREWSLDARRSRGRNAESDALDASLSVAILRIHLCIVYAAAGLSKAIGEQWWTGDAIWRALSLPRFQQFDLQFAAGIPLLLQGAALLTVALQLAYPILVWTRARALIVLVTELMHIGIAVFLGLWLFSVIMIVLNMAAFGESLWLAMRRWLSGTARDAAPAGRVEIVYDGACPFCSDYVRYQSLRSRAREVVLVNAREHPEVLRAHGIAPADLEDGMVVLVDGRAFHGAQALHRLSRLSDPPRRLWVRAIAALSRSPGAARALYPILKAGRRVALAALGISRFGGVPRPPRLSK